MSCGKESPCQKYILKTTNWQLAAGFGQTMENRLIYNGEKIYILKLNFWPERIDHDKSTVNQNMHNYNVLGVYF